MSKEAIKLALEFIQDVHLGEWRGPVERQEEVCKALEETLAKQEGQSNFCPQCEALARELKAIKQEQGEPVRDCKRVECMGSNGCIDLCWKQKPVGKLKVTLEDRPIDIELAQYKRMFEAACSALGEVSDALGCDPEEGGAEPLLAAIAELKTSKQEQGEPVAWTDENVIAWCLARGIKAAEGTPQQRKPLTDEQIDKAWRSVDYTVPWEQHRIDIARAIEAAHGIKE